MTPNLYWCQGEGKKKQPKEMLSWCKGLKLLKLTELIWFTPAESILGIYIWTLHGIYSIVFIIQYTFPCYEVAMYTYRHIHSRQESHH